MKVVLDHNLRYTYNINNKNKLLILDQIGITTATRRIAVRETVHHESPLNGAPLTNFGQLQHYHREFQRGPLIVSPFSKFSSLVTEQSIRSSLQKINIGT